MPLNVHARAWFLPLLVAAACENKPSAPAETSAAATASAAPAVTSPPSAAAPSAPAAASAEPAPLPPAPDRVPPADAIKTKSGLAMVVLTKGSGKKHPKPSDVVKAKFTGWTPSGQAFGAAEPSLLNMAQQPPGWAEALGQMVEGEKRRLWMPAKLAYGNAVGGPSEDLVLELELVSIPEPPPAPADVKAPPKDATKLPSGLAYKFLSHGTGTTHPTSSSRVTMHYTGWTKAGKMFDSSVMRGTPLTIGLGQVIPGWTEGVPVMVVGDKMRLWIPAALAYGVKPASPTNPAGDLVFDLELLAIK
ncbi:MAG TPA: FKBP-type peptidyl-prolyl cis-trans isomerase [Polyangiaceae bacterium]|nr:FKBP-type peptidyl-prolyl cis-trans isomerase [Polyangiaceae bacterium]